jgi:mRNA interferase MazF
MLRRGDVWWVRLDPTIGSEIAKTRPCLIVTTDILNERRRTVVVVPLSTSPDANPPLMVPVTCAGRGSVAVVDQIRAVSKDRFAKRIGAIPAPDLTAVDDALRNILDLL